jgi:hypothetical protein
MHEVVMKKDELLKALVENKAKHDTIFDAAVAGYWELAKEKIDEKRKQLNEAITIFHEDVSTDLKRIEAKVQAKETVPHAINSKGLDFSFSLNLAYPENHTKDYERAIRMMGASIYDEVRLSEQEFDQYVLNNWEWKGKFTASNLGYVNKARTLRPFRDYDEKDVINFAAYSGYTPAYVSARNDYQATVMASGMASF